MRVEELDDDQVVEKFEYICDRHPAYEDTKEEFYNEVVEETNDGEDIRTRVETAIRTHRQHDNLLESTISAFLPGGPVFDETGWTFLGAEPLSELNVPNADVIVGNPDRNMAVIVECKSGLSRPGQALTQLYDAADAVREYHDELAENIGMEIDDLECAICVSSTDDHRIAQEVERHEREDEARESVFIWRLHYLEEGEQLDLFTRLDTRDHGGATHNNELAQVLQAGVNITKMEQATPSFFPSSHLYRVMEEVFSIVLQKRRTEDGPIRHFTGAELLDILTDQRHLPHYDADVIGVRMYSELVDRLLQFDLITPIDASETDLTGDGEFYRYRVNGRSMGTLLNNLQDKYFEEQIEWELDVKAMRRTLEQYDEDQRRLDDF